MRTGGNDRPDQLAPKLELGAIGKLELGAGGKYFIFSPQRCISRKVTNSAFLCILRSFAVK